MLYFSWFWSCFIAVAVSNGTVALHLAAWVAEDDEVIVSSLTFAASANCVRYCGATPVYYHSYYE